jgi:hypothetical protein
MKDIRQTQIHTSQQLVPEPNCSEVETATEKLKGFKLTGTDEILAEFIQAGGNTVLTHSIWNRKELQEQWKESILFQHFPVKVNL